MTSQLCLGLWSCFSELIAYFFLQLFFPLLPACFHHQHLIQSVSTDLPRNVEHHQRNKGKHSSGFDKLIR